MKVIRKQMIDTELFELGDEIRFKLTTGEKVHAKAVQECEEGMLFITKDCIGKEMPMYKDPSEERLDYLHSDLRKYLNTELLSLFPEKIRSRMLPMMIEDSEDYIRIPTEKEIFGENNIAAEELYTKRFYGMKHHRNRITFVHKDEWKTLEWYWLQNYASCAAFAFVDGFGTAACLSASSSFGVRPVFMLSKVRSKYD